MNISEYESDLEGILTSVPNPFQVRFKSVPYIGDIIPTERRRKSASVLGRLTRRMKQTIDWDELNVKVVGFGR